jgi:hypothetical protein
MLKAEFVCELQDEIVSALEALDPSAQPFLRDAWQRPQGGSGKSCVFSSQTPTSILEKAGVNTSLVHGTLSAAAIKQMRADHTTIPLPEYQDGGLPFYAAGVSLVIHPRNPHAPTVHANYRYFEITLRRAPRMVVRRRLRPHAFLPLRRRRSPLPLHPQIRLRHARNPAIPRLQKMVQRVLSHHTPGRVKRPLRDIL